MDSGFHSDQLNAAAVATAGKRRRDGFPTEEDVKENQKVPRQWFGSQGAPAAGNGTKEGYQNSPHFQGLSVENLIRMQSEMAPVTPSLNMQQRVMAAAALQDLRGFSNETMSSCSSSKQRFFQPQQLQQHGKYGMQPQQPVSVPADSASGGQSPLRPFIRTPPLYSEAEIHTGSPTSSSSGPYPSLQTMAGGGGGAPRTSSAAPPPPPELETETSHSNWQGLLPQQTGQSSKSALLQAQAPKPAHSSAGGMLPSGSLHRPHQQGGAAALQTGLSGGGGGGAQSGSLLSQGDSPRRGGSNPLLQEGGGGGGGGHAVPNGLLLHKHNLHTAQNGGSQNNSTMTAMLMMQQGGGHHRTQNGGGMVLPHQDGHHHQGGIGDLQQQTGGPPPLLREFQGGATGSWYAPPSMREQATVAAAEAQQRQETPVPSSSATNPMFSSHVTEFGSQRPGLVTPPPSQLHHVQSGGYRDAAPPDQDPPHSSQSEGQSPLLLQQQQSLGPSAKGWGGGSSSSRMGKMMLPLQTVDLHGRRLGGGGGGFCSPSSSGGADPTMSSAAATAAAMMANGGGLDGAAFLQRNVMCPPKTHRSYTKVYKLGSITRAVDVNRFSNYTELRCELARMFNLEGQLEQKLGWQLVFTDNEDDLLLVGDDPWEEFVRNVRGIRILTPAEVYFYATEDKCGGGPTYNSMGGSSAPKQP